MTNASNAVPGFRPSVHGLHFANRFPPGPTVRLGFVDPRVLGVGDASAGLCGGMAWFVRERFEAGLPIPPDTVAPANGSPLFQALVRRQVLSLDWLRNPLRFWRAASMSPAALARRTLEVEWPRIRSAIDAGRLPMIGLVRHHGWNPFHLTKDHQVLAYAYEFDGATGAITIRLYDPNWPDRDDVAIAVSRAVTVTIGTEPTLGIIDLDAGRRLT